MLVGSRTIHVLRTRTRLRKVDKSKVVFTEGAAIWQQGDDALYTDDAMRQRAAVRHNPEVLEYLHLWWTTALNSMKRSKAKAVGAVGEPRLSKQYYVVMMKKMYKAMIEEYDEEDAGECAEEDWEHDAGGADTLSREGFCDAIFETADTWTKTCEAAEYAAFLRALHARLAQLGPDGKNYLWKDDHAIEFDPQFDDEALQSDDTRMNLHGLYQQANAVGVDKILSPLASGLITGTSQSYAKKAIFYNAHSPPATSLP